MKRLRLWLISKLVISEWPEPGHEVRKFHGRVWVLESIQSTLDYHAWQSQATLTYRPLIHYARTNHLKDPAGYVSQAECDAWDAAEVRGTESKTPPAES
jgi:hypothetical protein